MEIVKLINGLGETFFAVRLEETAIDTKTFFGGVKYKKRYVYLERHINVTFYADEYVLSNCTFTDLKDAEKRLQDYKEQQGRRTIVKVIERKCKCK